VANTRRIFIFLSDQLFQPPKPSSPGIWHVEKQQVRRVLFDQRQRFHAVLPLPDYDDFLEP